MVSKLFPYVKTLLIYASIFLLLISFRETHAIQICGQEFSDEMNFIHIPDSYCSEAGNCSIRFTLEKQIDKFQFRDLRIRKDKNPYLVLSLATEEISSLVTGNLGA